MTSKYLQEQTYQNLRPYAPVVLRIGVAFVMLWFGVQQLTNAKDWIGVLPAWTENTAIPQIAFIYLNSIFEIALGLCLVFGLYIRISALFLAIHMIGIIHTVGYNSTGIRDIGIAIATIAVALFGPDKISIDKESF